MSKTFEQGREEISKLCRYFATNKKAFFAPGIKEAHVRQSLIDPFFEVLGWDVRNTAMIAPQYREVIPEDSLEIEGHQKAPDYTFRVGTLPKFYAEAKKCGINIHADPGPAYQLRRYGWSAKVALSILTDFEEFSVYDCSMRPRQSDKAGYGRIHYFRNEEYPDRWKEIWEIFSREAVWSGAFDKFAASKRKRGTSEVDSEFLKEIEGWRDSLARNIALRNQFLGPDDLNKVVHHTIDRIIFLRMAEDRGIEPYGQLLKLCEQPKIYSRFMSKLCRMADEKYNSGLFHFRKEEDISESPDLLSPKLTIDDKVFKPILQSLYFEHGSPYHFGVLPVEILGTVYERFLGKVIRLTHEHRAKVEEKPEIRKAGGVYYTPAYIVDYIVKNTVGKLIEGKSPTQLAGGKNGQPLRVLDMACGSGSFLSGAFQCLLDHCQKWCEEHKPEKFKKKIYKNRKGEWRLTIAEKKRILTTHVFGVDIDPQAVEVSKLSLLLKVMEGETDETIGKTRMLFHERALPNLSTNIKCGNSLIGPDYFSGRLITDPKELRRLNPFDWKNEFAEVIKSGGFDCVIGNPPYVRIQTLQEWMSETADYFKQTYDAAKTGNYDIYVVFIERGISLLNSKGRLGFIMPQKFWQVQYGESLRELLSDNKHVALITSFGHNQVFANAFVNACILILTKMPSETFEFIELKKKINSTLISQALENSKISVLSSGILGKTPWILKDEYIKKLIEKISKCATTLDSCTNRIFQGLKTSADKIYVLDLIKKKASTYIAYSPQLGSEVEVEQNIFHTLIKGTEMRRYTTLPSNRILLFPYVNIDGKIQLISEKSLKKEYSKTYSYLKANEKYLRNRENGKMNHEGWYAYGRNQALDVISAPKIITPDLAPYSSFLEDSEGNYFFLGGAAGGYGIITKPNLNSRFLLGLLNSKLLNFFITSTGQQIESGYFSFEARFIRSAPIRIINLSNSSDISLHDGLVKLVNKMLSFHKQFTTTNSEIQKGLIQRQLDSSDREINRIVYELYGLTEDEIKFVEESNND